MRQKLCTLCVTCLETLIGFSIPNKLLCYSIMYSHFINFMLHTVATLIFTLGIIILQNINYDRNYTCASNVTKTVDI